MNPIIEITNFEFPELDVYARMKASFYILMSQTLGFLLQKAQKLLNGH